MKVEGQNSAKPIDFQSQSAEISHALVLIRLLSKCVREIEENIVNVKLAAGENEENKEGVSLKEGAGLSETKKAKSSNDVLLESILTALQMSGEIKDLSELTIRQVVEQISNKNTELSRLADEIASLKNELAGTISNSDLQKLSEELNSLESAYNELVNKYQNASNNYASNSDNAEKYAKQIKDLEGKYNAIENKGSPEAKALMATIEETKKLELFARDSMSSAMAEMHQVDDSIKSLISKVGHLSDQFPQISGKLNSLIALMNSKGSIALAVANLFEEIDQSIERNNQIEKKIEAKNLLQEELFSSILNLSEQAKGRVDKSNLMDKKQIEDSEAMKSINRVVQDEVEARFRKEQREEEAVIVLGMNRRSGNVFKG